MTEAVDLFLELAAIPSPPGEEEAVSEVVQRYLRDLGLDARVDVAEAVLVAREPEVAQVPLDDVRDRALLARRARDGGELEEEVDDLGHYTATVCA